MSRRGRWLLAAMVPLGAGAVLGAQIAITLGREYLPVDPGYRVEGVEVGDGGKPLRLAVVGDSTVAGVGSPEAASSLPVLIARRVADELDRSVIVDGHGVAGGGDPRRGRRSDRPDRCRRGRRRRGGGVQRCHPPVVAVAAAYGFWADAIAPVVVDATRG